MTPTERYRERAGDILRECITMARTTNGAEKAIDHLAAALADVRREAMEECVQACIEAVPRAHTYASENAALYRAGDIARDRCIAAIRAKIGGE